MGESLCTAIEKVILSPGKPDDGSADLSMRGSPVGGGVGVSVGLWSFPFLGVAEGVPGTGVAEGVPGAGVADGVPGGGGDVGVGGVVVTVRLSTMPVSGAALPGVAAVAAQAASSKPPMSHIRMRRGIRTSFLSVSGA